MYDADCLSLWDTVFVKQESFDYFCFETDVQASFGKEPLLFLYV